MDNSEPISDKTEQKKEISNIIDSIGKNSEPILKILSQIAKDFLNYRAGEREFEIALEEKAIKFRQKMGYLAIILMIFIVSVSGFLTYVNEIDGATFTFLLGIIVGYMLLFFKESVFPPG